MAAIPHEERERLVNEVCELVVEHGIMNACSMAGVSSSAFFVWIAKEEKWAEKYARAREAISYMVEPKLEAIGEDLRQGVIASDVARVLVDNEKWLAGKRNSTVYGDRKNIDHGGQKNNPVIVVANEEDKELLESI